MKINLRNEVLLIILCQSLAILLQNVGKKKYQKGEVVEFGNTEIIIQVINSR